MTRVSRRKIDRAVDERIRELLFDAVARLTKKEEVAEFFAEFFTPVERIMFSKRLAIAILLLKGYSYDSINQTIKVSTATIDNVNYWLKYSGRAFKKVVEKIVKKEQDEETWHNFWYSLQSSTVTMSRGNWAERRRNIESKHRDFTRKHVI